MVSALPAVRRHRAVAALCVALTGLLAGGAGLASAGATAPAVSKAANSRHAEHPTHNVCHKSRIDVPSCGVLWGLFNPREPVPGRSRWSAHYGSVEKRIGRRLDIVKNYEDWRHGDTFPSGPESKLAAGGKRILYYSWNAGNYRTHAKVSYRSIADGSWDKSVILPEARRLKHFHHKIFLDFNHEFDSRAQAGHGSPAEFVAAYRHIHNVFRRAGVTNVIWSWVSTGWIGNAADIKAGYPGARYVDWIGYDPYNLGSCAGRKWTSPVQTWKTFYRWVGRQHDMDGKPLLLSEYAAGQGPHIKAWYASIAHSLTRLPRIKALIQFSGTPSSHCVVALSASAAALDGFAKSATAPYVTGVTN
jgi:hypothetical protein